MGNEARRLLRLHKEHGFKNRIGLAGSTEDWCLVRFDFLKKTGNKEKVKQNWKPPVQPVKPGTGPVQSV